MPRRFLPVLSLCVLAAACTSTATTTSTTTTTTTTTAATTTTPATTTTTTAPTTSRQPGGAFTLDDHVAWLLALLNGEVATEDEYDSRFDEGFRAVVPYSAFVVPLAQLAGEWSVASDERAGLEATVRFAPADGPSLVATLSREPDAPGRLRGLLLQPGELDDPPQSLDVLAERWGELAPRAELLIADASGDLACTPVAGAATERQLAIGSVFKLWVLHALAAAVDEGGAAWDEVLPVRDELKSLPSGTMQDEPAGTEFTLEEHARLMISISDNTATDHLIDRLGRDAVEAAVVVTGHAQPARNRPFLTTREAFWLKAIASDAVVDRYLAGDEAERRAVLDEADIDPAAVEPDAFTGPRLVDSVEWFASVKDACRLLTILRNPTRDARSPVDGILTANPGVRIDAVDWPSVAFKGGSEPGVLALAWHAERADGRAFVIVGILNDPNRPVDDVTAILLAERAFELLAAG